MKYVLIIALILTGCSDENKEKYSNEQLVKDLKICTDAGLDYVILRDYWGDGTATSVTCIH